MAKAGIGRGSLQFGSSLEAVRHGRPRPGVGDQITLGGKLAVSRCDRGARNTPFGRERARGRQPIAGFVDAAMDLFFDGFGDPPRNSMVR